MIRVLVVDDHTLFREGVINLLSSVADIEVVGQAPDSAEALRLAKEQEPDVIVLDISISEEDGIETAKTMREQGIRAGIVFVTMHSELVYFDRAKREVAVEGYVLKQDAFESLISAVRNAKVGKKYVSPSLASEIIWSDGEPPAVGPLTNRETEILTLIAKGLRNREIAKQLGISIKTVESHRRHIFSKLGLKRTADIVRYSIRVGLIKP